MLSHATLFSLLVHLKGHAQDQSLIDALNDMQTIAANLTDGICKEILLDAWEFCMRHTSGDESVVRRKANYYGQLSPIGRAFELDNPVMLISKLKGLIERKYAELQPFSTIHGVVFCGEVLKERE